MDASNQPAQEPQMMRANHRVIETACSLCQQRFQLAEAVYACPFCQGFHHASCWEAHRHCATPAIANVIAQATITPPELAAEPLPETSVQTGGNGQVITDLECPRCKLISPPTSMRCDCGHVFQTTATSDIGESPLAEDEQRCLKCFKVIKREALKCRFCGQILHDELVGEIPIHISQEIEKRAGKALTFSLIGILCFGFVLEPLAVFNGVKTLKLMGQYPEYVSPGSARAKAIAGIIIGCIGCILSLRFVAGLLAKLSAN